MNPECECVSCDDVYGGFECRGRKIEPVAKGVKKRGWCSRDRVSFLRVCAFVCSCVWVLVVSHSCTWRCWRTHWSCRNCLRLCRWGAWIWRDEDGWFRTKKLYRVKGGSQSQPHSTRCSRRAGAAVSSTLETSSYNTANPVKTSNWSSWSRSRCKWIFALNHQKLHATVAPVLQGRSQYRHWFWTTTGGIFVEKARLRFWNLTIWRAVGLITRVVTW